MKNSEVIEAFVRGAKGQSGTLTSTGEKLFSYATIIAERIGPGFVVNKTKYSVTTTKQQRELQRTLDEWGKFRVFVTGIPLGATALQGGE